MATHHLYTDFVMFLCEIVSKMWLNRSQILYDLRVRGRQTRRIFCRDLLHYIAKVGRIFWYMVFAVGGGSKIVLCGIFVGFV